MGGCHYVGCRHKRYRGCGGMTPILKLPCGKIIIVTKMTDMYSQKRRRDINQTSDIKTS